MVREVRVKRVIDVFFENRTYVMTININGQIFLIIVRFFYNLSFFLARLVKINWEALFGPLITSNGKIPF